MLFRSVARAPPRPLKRHHVIPPEVSQHSRVILICTVALLVAIGTGYATLRWLAHSFGPPDETTNVAAYDSTLKQWAGSGLVAHFPAVVPPHAGNIRFAAFPGFLQGGAYVQLRIQMPAGDVQAIEEQLQNLTTHIYAGGGIFDHYNQDQKNNWPTATFRTSDNPKTTFEFPTHYTLYVLSAKDRKIGRAHV